MLYSRGCVSGASCARTHGRSRHSGFSLIELVCSALLIAAIAILSLPTIQGLSPADADSLQAGRTSLAIEADTAAGLASEAPGRTRGVVNYGANALAEMESGTEAGTRTADKTQGGNR